MLLERNATALSFGCKTTVRVSLAHLSILFERLIESCPAIALGCVQLDVQACK
jgi:hypothetical protein